MPDDNDFTLDLLGARIVSQCAGPEANCPPQSISCESWKKLLPHIQCRLQSLYCQAGEVIDVGEMKIDANQAIARLESSVRFIEQRCCEQCDTVHLRMDDFAIDC